MLSFLVRVILFAIAISVVRSLVTAVQRIFSGGRTQPTVRPTRSAGAQASTTMLQQDPVCGTYVAVDTSLKRVVNGRVVHFCSPECRDRYAA
jgi:YHS domain-containing protein